MSFEVLNDFKFYGEVPIEVIEKYKDIIPPELLEIWQNYGFGTFANGYIKIINPDDYVEFLERSYYASNVSVPIFTTGLADIITFRKGKFVGIVNYRKKDCDVHPLLFKRFLTHFKDSEMYKKFFDNNQYNDAIHLLGKLEYDECFGYVPLLALGGSEKVERLQKMKIIPHIELMIQAIGRIE